MATTRMKRAIATAAIAGAVVTGAVLPALAQDDTTSEESAEDGTPREEARAAREAAFAEALADELGIEQDRVEDALAAVRERLRAEWEEQARAALEERLAQAVEDGDLTQEQADAILEATESGVLPFGGRHGHRGHGPGWRFGPGPEASSDA